MPPLPPEPPRMIGSNYSKAVIIELKNNLVYFQDKALSSNELEKLLNDIVENKNPIVSLYDFNSNYGTFLNLNLIISDAFHKKRQALSMKMFNKKYSDLDKESAYKIKEALPMIHFWDYSTAHFNEVIKKDGTFLGLRIQ